MEMRQRVTPRRYCPTGRSAEMEMCEASEALPNVYFVTNAVGQISALAANIAGTQRDIVNIVTSGVGVAAIVH